MRENLSPVFPTRSGINRALQPQKVARGLKFRFRKLRDCPIYVMKTKAPISCIVTKQLICAFVSAYVKRMFSHVGTQMNQIFVYIRKQRHRSALR